MFLNTELAEYAKRLVSKKGQEDKTFKLVLDNEVIKKLIIFLNTDEQLGKEHVDGLGNELFNVFTNRGFYSQFDPKGRGGKPYTLNDTGSFWDSFTVAVQQGRIIIDANPFKDGDNLFDAYGQEIVGSPFANTVVPGPTSAVHTKITGSGISRAIAGIEAFFFVTLRDSQYNDRGTSMDQTVTFDDRRMACIDQGGGVYRCSYLLTLASCY